MLQVTKLCLQYSCAHQLHASSCGWLRQNNETRTHPRTEWKHKSLPSNSGMHEEHGVGMALTSHSSSTAQ